MATAPKKPAVPAPQKVEASNIADALNKAFAEIAKGTNMFSTEDAKVRWEGTEIVLPASPHRMNYNQAIGWLTRMGEEEEKEIAVFEEVKGFPLDAAVAFSKALRRTFGWASPVPTPGFFGPKPPVAVSVQVGPHETATVFWGGFQVPNVEGMLSTNANWEEMKFIIGGKVKAKNLPIVHALGELTRKIMAEESIYRGQAIRLNVDDDGDFNQQTPPEFIDTAPISADEMIFSDSLLDQVRTNLFAPIECTARCREFGIPMKRGVLLEGPFGTGKTLCAAVTAKKCVENGWTFITVGRVTALQSALMFAKMYEPCVVFVEDIDREMEGARDAEMDDILNIIDGVISKGAEIMVVLTSNNAEAINKAMLRPGRLDAVLRIDPPDSDAAEKLMRLYGRGLIAPDHRLDQAKHELAGQIPAVIRECVERAKLWAIARGVERLVITDEDIARAARGMRRHLELLRGPMADNDTSPEYALGKAVADVVNHSLANGHADGFSEAFRALQRKIGEIHKATT